MLNVAPTGPEPGGQASTPGMTVKTAALLAWPPTVTTTLAGPTGAEPPMKNEIWVAVQKDTPTEPPLKVTKLVPWLAPKLLPLMFICDRFTGPEVGDRLLMVGDGMTVKVAPLLVCPPTETTTLPVVAVAGTNATMLVALQLEIVAVALLKKITVLLP